MLFQTLPQSRKIAPPLRPLALATLNSWVLALVLVLWQAGFSSRAASTPPEPYDSQRDGQAPMPAEEALASFELPADFAANVYAAEPMVRQPIDLKIDRRDRVWVVENYTYSDRAIGWHEELRDRIVVLEDTDRDGVADRKTVFWDQGHRLTSVEIGHGGVWALAPPVLWFIPWTDEGGELRPDGEPVAVVDGFVVGNVRHNVANGLMWGPDGWLYGRHGIQDTSFIGRPGAADGERLELNCSIWRVHPVDHRIEVVWRGGTNPWGMDYDRHGEWFLTNTVIGHLWHVIPGGHGERMYGTHANPHLYTLLQQTADHYHFDVGKGWSETRLNDPSTDELGGGHAHIGCLIYQGDNWPADMRHKLYTLNFHGRRVNVERLERHGAGFTGLHEPDMLQSGDPWFRGMELRTMADGTVLVSDWSDTGDCHNHDGVHRNSGRLYRFAHGEPARAGAKPPTVDDLKDAQLAAMLTHENSWHWRGALLTLQERGFAGRMDEGTPGLLLALLADRDKPVPVRLRALWALAAAAPLEQAFLRSLFDEEHEALRVWAVRLLLEELAGNGKGEPLAPETVGALKQLAANDPSGLVRLYLAAGVRRLPSAPARDLAAVLAQNEQDADDANLPVLLWHTLEPLVTADADAAIELLTASRLPLLRRSISRRLTSELDDSPEWVDLLVAAAAAAGDDAGRVADVLEGMRDGMRGRAAADAPEGWDGLTAAWRDNGRGDDRINAAIDELAALFGDGRALDSLEQLVRRRDADPLARRQALRALAQARVEDLPAMLFEMVNDRAIETEVLRALAVYDHEQTPEAVIRRFNQLGPAAREAALDTLSSRPAYARALMEAIDGGRIDKTALSAWHLRQLRLLDDQQVTAALALHWQELTGPDAGVEEAKQRWREQLDEQALAAADLPNGRLVYQMVCASCHQLYGEGRNVGPDLTGSDRRNLEYLLDNMLDPSAIVTPEFEASLVTLADGRVVTGMVSDAGGGNVWIQTPAETLTVREQEVESVQGLGVSLMPAGIIDALTEDQARDLIAYLMHPRQVPLPEGGR